MKRYFGSFILLVLFSTSLFAQNGTRLVGFDAQSMGRGGTSIGVFDSPELMMTNPAGISFVEKSMLNADLSLMFPALHFKNTINDAEGDKNTFPLPSIGYINKYAGSKFSWGVGMFTTGGMGADFNLKHALYRNTDGSYNLQKYHSKLAEMQGGLTVAYQLNEQLSVGASLHLVYSMVDFEMPYSLDPSIMKGTAIPGMTFGQMFAAPPTSGGFGYDEVTASAKMSDLTAFGFNGKIGVAYKVNEKLSLGLNYTLPSKLNYTGGKAVMDMTQQFNDAFGKAVSGYMSANPTATQAQAQGAVMANFAAMGIDLSKGVKANYKMELELAFPQSIGFGASYQATECLKLAADVEWLNWAAAFDKMTLKLTDGDNSNINTMLGNSGSFNLDFPMNWKNSVIVKIGGEYKASKALTVRLGYAYGSNPVPESTIIPILPAIVENHITLGGSYKLSEPLTIHAAVEMVLNKSLSSSNPNVIADEYDASTSELATTLIHVSCSYAF